GKVGLNGISYYAMNQWQVAALEPPHLAALCVWEGAADYYRDLSHHGGILCAFGRAWFPSQVVRGQPGRGAKGHRGRVDGARGAADQARGRARGQPPRLLRGLLEELARQRRVLALAHARLVEGEGAAALVGQLGRAGAPPARQLRGVRARGVQAEVARGARHRALETLLHRLRRESPEAGPPPLP